MRAERIFEQTYPALTRWIQRYGWLELGQVDWSRSLIRALDEGGLVWEGGTRPGTLSDALAEAETALEAWFAEQAGPC